VRAKPSAAAVARPLRGAAAVARLLRGRAVLCGAASLLAVAGCASDDEDRPARADSGGGQAAREQGIRPVEPDPAERDPAGGGPSSHAPPVEPATCPPGAGNCRSATGRILYVERVDPDGDGDAHFVLASRDSITGPGISVIDVKRSLRPSPLPGRGDRVSAAGPVYRGSYGQRQIEAVELNVSPGR
jgi:hypothetical protein